MRIPFLVFKFFLVSSLLPGCLSLAAFSDSGGDEAGSAAALLPLLGLSSSGTSDLTSSSEAVMVSGTLRDSGSGEPLNGAEVVFGDASRSEGASLTRSVTNSSGRWAYEVDLPAGTEITLSAEIVYNDVVIGSFVIRIIVTADEVTFELVSFQGSIQLTITVVRPGNSAADITPPVAQLNVDGLSARNTFVARMNGQDFDDVTADEDLIFEFYVKEDIVDTLGGPGIEPEYVFVGPPTTPLGDHLFELKNLPYGKTLYLKMHVVDEAGNRFIAPGDSWFVTFPEDEYVLFMPESSVETGAYVPGAPRLAYGQNMARYGSQAVRGDAVFGKDKIVNISGQRSKYGVLWSDPVTLPLGWYPRSITYGEHKFVAVGDAGLRLIFDGNAYHSALISGGPDLNDIAYGGGVFVAVGDDGRRVRSEDGITWTHDQTAGAPAAADFASVTYGDGVFVAAGGAYTMRSTDGGQTWTDLIHQGSWTGAVAYGHGRFVLSMGDRTFVSTDGGKTWNDPGYDNLDRTYYGKMKFFGGRFILHQDGGRYGAYSTDGVTWYQLGSSWLGFEPAGIVFVDHQH